MVVYVNPGKILTFVPFYGYVVGAGVVYKIPMGEQSPGVKVAWDVTEKTH